MKSQAVFVEGCGMPGVSGELNDRGPPMSAGLAKLPGLVPCLSVEGFPPRGGRLTDLWVPFAALASNEFVPLVFVGSVGLDMLGLLGETGWQVGPASYHESQLNGVLTELLAR
jgi:hypothetical protein